MPAQQVTYVSAQPMLSQQIPAQPEAPPMPSQQSSASATGTVQVDYMAPDLCCCHPQPTKSPLSISCDGKSLGSIKQGSSGSWHVQAGERTISAKQGGASGFLKGIFGGGDIGSQALHVPPGGNVRLVMSWEVSFAHLGDIMKLFGWLLNVLLSKGQLSVSLLVSYQLGIRVRWLPSPKAFSNALLFAIPPTHFTSSHEAAAPMSLTQTSGWCDGPPQAPHWVTSEALAPQPRTLPEETLPGKARNSMGGLPRDKLGLAGCAGDVMCQSPPSLALRLLRGHQTVMSSRWGVQEAGALRIPQQ
ncbi:unnamed protein product [Chrysoparadoxa australica]